MKEETTGLPKGWAMTSVGEIYEIVGGGTPSTSVPEYWNGEIPWITSADILGLKEIIPRKFISKMGVENSATHVVPEKSLIVVTRVGLGKIGLTESQLSFSQDSQALVQPSHLTYPEYALYYLSTAVKMFKYRHRGTTIAGVTKKQLSELSFPLPPLNEQMRIANKVEELFSFLDAGVASLRMVQAQLKRYRQAILKAAISGDLTKEWRDKHSNRLLSSIEYEKVIEGQNQNFEYIKLIKRTEKFFQEKNLLKKLPESWVYLPLVKVATLHRGFDLPQERRKTGPYPVVASSSIVGFHNEAKIKAPGVITGRSGTIGEVRYIESDFWPLNTTLYVCDFHGNNPKFIAILLESMQIQKFLAGTGVPTLNRNTIHPFQVPLPQLPEQLEIVSKTEQLFSVIDQIESFINKSKSQSDRLKQSILKDAFTGSLVPQDRSDEPAEKLLERIKAEQLSNKSKNNQMEMSEYVK